MNARDRLLKARKARRRPSKTLISMEDVDFTDITIHEPARRCFSTDTRSSSMSADDSTSPVVLVEVLNHLAPELVHRQWKSPDLVGHALGDIVSLELATKIMLFFLHFGILKVHAGEHPLARSQWPSACAHSAAVIAAMCAPTDDLSEKAAAFGLTEWKTLDDRHRWTWVDDLKTLTESDTVKFFNTVGALGYLAACHYDSTFSDSHKYRTRLITMPRPRYRLPLPHQGHDCRPDFIALDCSAFYKDRLDERTDEFHPTGSPMSSIIRLLSPLSTSGAEQHISLISSPTPHLSASGVPLHLSSVKFTEIIQRDLGAPPVSMVPEHDPDALLGGTLQEKLELCLQELPSLETIEIHLSDHSRLFDRGYVDKSRVSWPNVLFVGENKNTDMHQGIAQEFVYMQQQRCTQPHLRYVLGLAFTEDEFTFIRADAIGTERQSSRKVSCSGVLDTIRLILGLTVASDAHLGVHPAFDFVDTVVPARGPWVEEKTPTGATKRKQAQWDHEPELETEDTEQPQLPEHFRYRRAAFISLTGMRLSHDQDTDQESDCRYFLRSIIDSRGSLVGRRTCVWEAYKEVDPSDPAICEEDRRYFEQIEQKYPVYVGPYALKIQNADMSSQTYKHKLVEAIQSKVRSEDGTRYLLVPDRVWYADTILDVVRGFSRPEQVPAAVVDHALDRQEMFSVSPLKRTLGQYRSFEEVARAIVDVYRGLSPEFSRLPCLPVIHGFVAISWLDQHGYVHRDVSDGNVLLAQENISCLIKQGETWLVDLLGDEGSDNVQIKLKICRRNSDPESQQTDKVYGLLHDLDMVGLKAPNSKNIHDRNSNVARFQMGTPPYMSIKILLGYGPLEHTIIDDAQSIFYVLYLHPFTHGMPLVEDEMHSRPYPRSRWPQCIRDWATGPKFLALGATKDVFFQTRRQWLVNALPTLPNSGSGYWATNASSWLNLILFLHDEIWLNGDLLAQHLDPLNLNVGPDDQRWMCRRSVDVARLIEQLDARLDELFPRQ